MLDTPHCLSKSDYKKLSIVKWLVKDLHIKWDGYGLKLANNYANCMAITRKKAE